MAIRADRDPKVATIECATCSALIEVFPSIESYLEWDVLGEDTCQSPPLNRRPYARNEIKRCFPDFDG